MVISRESSAQGDDGASCSEDEEIVGGGEATLKQDDDGVLVLSTTFALCICMLAHSYLLISVFPYSGFMALHLLDNVVDNEDTAAQYAGLIASAFMVGRAVTSIVWGQVADRYGRTVALYASLLLSCLCSILFGITTSFTAAMVLRFLLGCSNGIMSTIKTIVSEISTGERNEARTMSIVMGMWGWGFLVSPLLSGILAEPVKQYPNASWLAEGTVGGDVLREYPFLLPNVLGAAICLLGTALTYLTLRETLPPRQQHSILHDLKSRFWTMVSCCCGCGHSKNNSASYHQVPSPIPHENNESSNVSHHQPLDNNYNDEDTNEFVRRSIADRIYSSTMVSILSRKDTRDCLLLYWGYSFVSLTVDEAFPLFCLSHTAGFGIPEKEIGKVMSFSGLIFAASQYGVYNLVYDHCGGLVGSIKAGTALSAPLMFLVPGALLLNRHGADSTLRWSTFVYLAMILAFHRIFGMVFFSSISVALNRTVSTSNRGAMNGISVLGGSIAKAIGPAFAGILTTLSTRWLGNYASLLIFGCVGFLGLVLTWSTFVFLPPFDHGALTRIDESNDDNDEEMYTERSLMVELKEQPRRAK